MKKVILILMLLGTIGYTANRITNADIASNAAIIFSKLQDADGVSVLGRSANSTGALDEIVAGADGDVLRRSGTTVGFGDITLGALPQSASGEVLGNSTGSTADVASTTLTALIDRAICSTQGSLLYRAASSWLCLAPGTSGQVLQTNGAGANPSWATGGGGSGSVYSALFNCSRPVADSNTRLLLTFNETASAYDYGPTRYAATQNNSATSGDTGQVKFGAGSFNQGSSENWQYSGPGALGSGDFTVDFWVYNTNWSSGVKVIAGTQDGADSFWQVWYRTLSPVGLTWTSPSGNVLSGVSPPSNNTWAHIAIVRSSGTIKMYVDGVEQASASDSRNYDTTQVRVGYSTVEGAGFSGFIDEFRISNTARWTSNFTPPTSAYDVAPVITKGSDFISSISSSIATAGTCQPQFIGGIFSTAPACTVSALNATAASYANHYQASTTSQAFVKNIVSGSAADGQVYMICK